MKRRKFLKGLFGILAVPTISIAKLSRGINTPSVKSKNIINFNNIKVNGVFNEWIESIRIEIKRLLAPVNKYDNMYSVSIKPDDWGYEFCDIYWVKHLKKKYTLPAKMIVIQHIGIMGLTTFDDARNITYFGFAKHEFEHKRFGMGNRKYLKNLVNTRFNSMLWSLEDQREKNFKLLRKFDPKHETPNDYLH